MNLKNNPPCIKEAAITSISQPVLPAVIEHTAQQVFASFSDRLKATLNGRQDRALKLALNGHVVHKSGRIFSVRSEDGQHSYLVDLDKRFCTCPDSRKGQVCKHRLAAYLIEQSTQANKETSMGDSSNPEHPPLKPEEEALEKARLTLNAKSDFLRQAIIYAVLQGEGQPIQVEILNLEGGIALVRALPKVVDGQLIPQFPFPERQSSAQVLAKSLSDIKIYR